MPAGASVVIACSSLAELDEEDAKLREKSVPLSVGGDSTNHRGASFVTLKKVKVHDQHHERGAAGNRDP